MIGQILKVIGAGILGGIFLFAVPFPLFNAFLFFISIRLAIRLLGWRRWWYYYYQFSQRFYAKPHREQDVLKDHLQQNTAIA